jgi:hypothetical protein
VAAGQFHYDLYAVFISFHRNHLRQASLPVLRRDILQELFEREVLDAQ